MGRAEEELSAGGHSPALNVFTRAWNLRGACADNSLTDTFSALGDKGHDELCAALQNVPRKERKRAADNAGNLFVTLDGSMRRAIRGGKVTIAKPELISKDLGGIYGMYGK